MKIGEAEGIAFAMPRTVVEYLLSMISCSPVTSTTGEASDLPGKTEDGQQSPADQPETAGKRYPYGWLLVIKSWHRQQVPEVLF